MGIFSEFMAKLGATKVYAVESNRALFELARERLTKYPNVETIHADIREFKPNEEVNVLVHELFGQLLYDEDLYTLDELKFTPQNYLPDYAVLMGGLVASTKLVDETVTPAVLQKLSGVLIAGLFDDQNLPLQFPVIDWYPHKSKFHTICDISKYKGDLLYFGIQIFHNDRLICQSALCENWSYVWTPRQGDKFELKFLPNERGMKVEFSWLG